METTLHRQLKSRFGDEAGGRSEVMLAGYRVDAMAPDGGLVEVQSAPLGALKGKLQRLLPEHRVRIVKPVIVARRLIRRARRDGADLSARRSPRRGAVCDVFDELVGLARIFPHPNLRIDLLAVTIDEVRVLRRRRPGYTVADRRLTGVGEMTSLVEAQDLWSLIPEELPCPFTTRDLTERLGRPIAFAQRVAYCLRLSGAARVVAKAGNRLVYIRAPWS